MMKQLAKGWLSRSLKELGKIYSGATPSTHVKAFWNGDIAWITPNDLSRLRTRHIYASERHITEAGLQNSSATLLPADSLVISSRAPIGYLAIPKIDFCTNQGCKTLVFRSDQVPEFHYYIILLHIKGLKEKGEGTTIAEISKTALEKIELPVPATKAVQSKIAEILSALDLLIEQTESLIAKYQRIKTGLLHDLLTRGIDEHSQLRHPDTHKFKPSPLGMIPEGWSTDVLQDIVESHRPIVYGILMPGYGFPGGVPVIKVKDIIDNEIRTDDLLLTDPQIDEMYARSRLRIGDLLFTIRGTVGRMAFVPPILDKANITQDTARISVAKANPKFVRYYLDMPLPRYFIDLHTLGLAVHGINLRDVRRIPVANPPFDEQDRIVEILDTVSNTIKSEMVHYQKLHRLKTGLMQDLLTGRVLVEPLLDNTLGAP